MLTVTFNVNFVHYNEYEVLANLQFLFKHSSKEEVFHRTFYSDVYEVFSSMPPSDAKGLGRHEHVSEGEIDSLEYK